MRASDENGKDRSLQPKGIWHPRRNGEASDSDLKKGILKPAIDTQPDVPEPSTDDFAEERESFFES